MHCITSEMKHLNTKGVKFIGSHFILQVIMTLLAHRDLNMFVWELLVCSGVCMVFWAVSVAPPEDWKMKPAAKLWGRIDLFLRAALKKKKKKRPLTARLHEYCSDDVKSVGFIFSPVWYINNTQRRASVFHKSASSLLKVEGCVLESDPGNVSPVNSPWTACLPARTQSPL